MPSSLRPLVLTAGVGLIAAASAAGTASAAGCPKHSNELARTSGGVVWHDATSLFVCAFAGDDRPVSKKLGPWTQGTKVAFDGSTVLWTVRKKVPGGKTADRVWAASGPSTPWLKGVTPTTGPTAKVDGTVAKLAAGGEFGAWITTKGTVMLASSGADDADVSPIGADTPGAAAPIVPGVTDAPGLTADDVLSYPQGLAKPMTPVGKRVLIGRWTALAGKPLESSLKLHDTGGGEGDDCGGSQVFEVTVRPIKAQSPVGARWSSYYQTGSKACNG